MNKSNKVNEEQAAILMKEFSESGMPHEIIFHFIAYCIEKNATDYLQCLMENGLVSSEIVEVATHSYNVTDEGKDKIYIGEDGLPHPLPGHEELFELITASPETSAIN